MGMWCKVGRLKKHIKYESDGNTTQRTSKDEMAWLTEVWHADLWHQPRDGHWQTVMVKTLDTTQIVEDGNG